MKVDYRALCQEYNQHAAKDLSSIKVEFTGFEPIHRALPGRNGVSTLLELQTRVLEAEELRIEHDKTYVTLYLHTSCRWGHGFGTDRCIGVKVRDPKGKTRVVELADERDNEENVRRLEQILGTAPSQYAHEEYKRYWSTKIDKVVDNALASKRGKPTPELAREFSREYLSDLVAYTLRHCTERGKEFEESSKLFAFAGYKLIEVFLFDFKQSFTVDFVLKGKSSVEFGWHTSQTYNSLPCTLKLSKVKAIKTVGLRELGVEKAGYYSHDDKMQVRPEQAKAAKKFARRFEAKKTQAVEKTLREVA